MARLQDKDALITGVGSGIRQTITLAFPHKGADIAINDVRNEHEPEHVAASVSAEAT